MRRVNFSEKYCVFILDRSLDCKTGNDIFHKSQFYQKESIPFCCPDEFLCNSDCFQENGSDSDLRTFFSKSIFQTVCPGDVDVTY